MNISEYAAASPAERAALRATWSRRADSAIRRLRRSTEVEIAEAARARYPEAVKVRVSVDDGDDAWCMAVGIYGPRGTRLALDDYDAPPTRPHDPKAGRERLGGRGQARLASCRRRRRRLPPQLRRPRDLAAAPHGTAAST